MDILRVQPQRADWLKIDAQEKRKVSSQSQTNKDYPTNYWPISDQQSVEKSNGSTAKNVDTFPQTSSINQDANNQNIKTESETLTL